MAFLLTFEYIIFKAIEAKSSWNMDEILKM